METNSNEHFWVCAKLEDKTGGLYFSTNRPSELIGTEYEDEMKAKFFAAEESVEEALRFTARSLANVRAQ